MRNSESRLYVNITLLPAAESSQPTRVIMTLSQATGFPKREAAESTQSFRWLWPQSTTSSLEIQVHFVHWLFPPLQVQAVCFSSLEMYCLLFYNLPIDPFLSLETASTVFSGSWENCSSSFLLQIEPENYTFNSNPQPRLLM